MNLLMTDIALNRITIEDTSLEYVDLSQLKIHNCVGCYCCWTKTPGQCIIRDDATRVYPLIAKSENVIYVTKVKFGCYDTLMKTMLERALPIQQAFIRLYHGEAHHVQREVEMKCATIIAYGDLSNEERKVFERLVERNAHNMVFKQYKVMFVSEEELLEQVQREVAAWGN